MPNLGSLQIGTEESTEFGFYGFQGGLNIKSAPQQVADNELTIATNVYLNADGGVRLRNGMAAYGTATTGNGPTALARFFQGINNGNVVTPETVQLLVQHEGILYNATISSNTSLGSIYSGSASSAQAMSWARFEQAGGQYKSGLTDCIVICTGSGGPYVYDGTNLYTPSGWSAAASARWCAVVNGIIWFGGIPAYPNQIFGSGDGILAPYETLPAYRNFVFSAPVTGLLGQGTGSTATLVIGRNTGLSVLYGTGVSTFFLQDIPYADGVTAGLTMVSSNGYGYWLGRNAVYMFDGQSVPKQISQKVEPWILNDPLYQQYPMSANRQLSWSCIYNNRLHIGYCSLATEPNVILCYDLTLQAWTVLTPTPGISSMILLDAPTDPSPYQAVASSSTSGQVYYWDYVPPAAIPAPAYDNTTVSSGIYRGTNPVLAQVQSKFFKLGVPGTNKALQRWYPEYQIAGLFSVLSTVATDYGAVVYTAESAPASTQGGFLYWAPSLTATYDGIWGGTDPTTGLTYTGSSWAGIGFSNYGSPNSRIDVPGTQAESFAFGIVMAAPYGPNGDGAVAPWIWAGGTGVYTQRGRT